MVNLNSDLAGSLQSINFANKILKDNTFVDLNINGYKIASIGDPESLVLANGNANANRVLLWLASKPDDYVRESFKGGILYSLVGKLGNEITFKEAETYIRNEFNNQFANDLTLMYINLSINKQTKRLNIDMIISDKLTKNTQSMSTEVII